MSKSILTIAGIGIAGCLLLSLMMKELAQHRGRRAPRQPVAPAFAERLTGPLRVTEEWHGERVRVVVLGRVRPGQDKRALAAAIGSDLWRSVGGDPAVDEVHVTLRDADGGGPEAVFVPRPPAVRTPAPAR